MWVVFTSGARSGSASSSPQPKNGSGAGCSAGRKRLEKHDAARGQLAAPQEEHENLLIEALRDAQLLLSEPAQRMTTKLGWREFSFYDYTTRGLPAKLLNAGKLERVPETYPNQTRYRWHGKRHHDPIIDLERAYRDVSEERPA